MPPNDPPRLSADPHMDRMNFLNKMAANRHAAYTGRDVEEEEQETAERTRDLLGLPEATDVDSSDLRSAPEPDDADEPEEETQGTAEPDDDDSADDQDGDTVTAAPEADDDPEVEVVVDGRKRKVHQSELVKNYQLDRSSQRRFEDAARRQRELDERERAIAAREAQPEQPKDQPDTKLEDDESEVDAEIKALSHSIYSGDEDEIAQNLKRFVSNRRQPAAQQPQEQRVDPVAIANQANRIRDFQEQTGRVRQEYPVLEKNAVLRTEVSRRAHEIRLQRMEDAGFDVEEMRANPGLSVAYYDNCRLHGHVQGDHYEIYRDATEGTLKELRGHLDEPEPQPEQEAAPTPANNSARRLRKKRAAQSPRGGNTRAQAQTKPKLQSGSGGSETVAWLKQQRGLA